jgi:hypothetical protein
LKRVFVPLAALSCWGFSSLAFAQCAMCKTMLTNSPEGRAISGRFNVAIVVMIVAPYLIFSGVLVALFRNQIGLRLDQARATARQLLRPTPRPQKNLA